MDLTPNDSDAFRDLRKLEPYTLFNRTVECPVCKGYGMWNLTLNVYMRHKNPADRHFHMSCGQCDGYGYVNPNQTCIHQWGVRETIGKSLHRVKCTKCNQVKTIDSGD